MKIHYCKFMKIFLGGTCANTTWRNELIPLLESQNIDYFNPVVEDWTSECQQKEEDEKNNKCDVHLYVITKEMKGVYSIAEVINSAWQSVLYGPHVDYVIFCILDEGKWEEHEKKSFNAAMKMVANIAPHNSLSCYVNNMEELSELFEIVGDVLDDDKYYRQLNNLPVKN